MAGKRNQEKVCHALVTFIHQPKPKTHRVNLVVIIYSGQEASDDFSVNKSLKIFGGAKQMNKFLQNLPEYFEVTLLSKFIMTYFKG